MNNFNYLKVSLTILTLCSIVTFYGVWQILAIHNRIIKKGARTDLNLISMYKSLEGEDANCQDRLKILELENKIFKEQLETLFEFHEKDTIKAKVIFTD